MPVRILQRNSINRINVKIYYKELALVIVEANKTHDWLSKGLRTNRVRLRGSSKVVGNPCPSSLPSGRENLFHSTDWMRPVHTGKANFWTQSTQVFTSSRNPLTDTPRIILDLHQLSEHLVA